MYCFEKSFLRPYSNHEYRSKLNVFLSFLVIAVGSLRPTALTLCRLVNLTTFFVHLKKHIFGGKDLPTYGTRIFTNFFCSPNLHIFGGKFKFSNMRVGYLPTFYVHLKLHIFGGKYLPAYGSRIFTNFLCSPNFTHFWRQNFRLPI